MITTKYEMTLQPDGNDKVWGDSKAPIVTSKYEETLKPDGDDKVRGDSTAWW